MEEVTLLKEGRMTNWIEKMRKLRRTNRLETKVKIDFSETSRTSPLLILNLLNDLVTLSSLLPGEIRRGAWLDAFLLAAGMNQIIEDELHPDPWFLGKAEKYLSHIHGPIGNRLARLVHQVNYLILWARSRLPQSRLLTQWQRDLSGLVQLLAERIICSRESPRASREDLLTRANRLVDAVDRFSERTRHSVLRLPSCFRSFDQHPDDLKCLAEVYMRGGSIDRPLVVVGVRTSGSYMAPLLAAALKVVGVQEVHVLTFRPGRRLMPVEKAVLKSTATRGGQVLITDDPPESGGSLASAAMEVQSLGIESEQIVFLLQLFGPVEGLPKILHGYQTVILPWKQWSLQERLDTHSVQKTLNTFWAPEIKVEQVELLPLPDRKWDRSHAHARFRVSCSDTENGEHFERQVSVKGVGLGYFGQHSMAVAQLLPGYTPTIYGLKDGLLYREWLPEANRLYPEDDGQAQVFIHAVARYITERSRALKVSGDVSQDLFGRRPVWEVASNLFSHVFGQAWVVTRLVLVDPLIKHLLKVDQPSVIDGSMDQFRWFTRSDHNHLVKIDSDERDFSNLDLYCYDPVYDLAGAALGLHSPAMIKKLRSEYTRLSGEKTDEERWLLYSLVHMWDRHRIQSDHTQAWTGEGSRALQEYFGTLYFSDLDPALGERLIALDVDGVLETNALGFPSLSPSSALALRALIQHGYCPVIATGRSLNDVRERCEAYKLPGGVAEYGAVVYNHMEGEAISLLTNHQTSVLNELRRVLLALPGVKLDPDYRYAVRAFQIDKQRQRRGLDAALVSTAILNAGGAGKIRSIPGKSQTDFMVSGIDKSSGLRVLGRQLGAQFSKQADSHYIFAVGDTIEDLPMLRMAEQSAAPAHAAPVLRPLGVHICSRPYQAGTIQAVGRLIGHKPGECSICQGPNLTSNSKVLLNLLAIQENGKVGMLRNALRLVPIFCQWIR